MENDRGDVSGSMCKYQERKKIKLLRREATENPESKLEVVRQNVDMIPQPSIQDNPNTELGTPATVQLRRRKRRTKKTLLSEDTENPERKLEDDCQNVDVIPQSSIQDNPNTELDKTATVQMRKHKRRTKRKLLSEDTENPEKKLEVSRQNVDIIITQPSIQDNPNTDQGTTATIQLSKRQIRKNRKLLREETENLENKLEVPFQNVDVITQPFIQDNPNTDLGTTAPVQPSKCQMRKNRKLLREETENPESKLEVPFQNVDVITESESSISKREGYMEIAKVEKGSSRTTSVDVKSESKREEYMEIQCQKGEKNMKVAISETVSNGTAIIDTGSKRGEYMGTASGEMASGTIATPDAEMASKGEEHTEVANGQMESDMAKNVHVKEGTTQKKKKKKSRKEKPTLGEILNSRQLEDMEVAIGETASGTIATPDADMVSKGEEHTEVTNGQIGLDMPKNVHVEGTAQKKKKKKSRKEKPTLGENLNSRQLEDMEVAIGETASGTIATPDADMVSKREEHTEVANGPMGSDMPKNVHLKEGTMQKKKKKKSRKEKPTLGENLNSRQLEDMEVAIGETASGTIATPDADMVLKGEEHTEVANGPMGSDMPKNVHLKEGTAQKKKKKKSRKEKPTLGENLNSQQLEDMEVAIGETSSGTTATDNIASKKRKRQKLENKDPASGDILGTRECIQDMALAKKDLTSNRVFEPTSGESISCKTAIPDAKIVSKGKEHTEVANGEMGSSKTENLNVNGTIQKRNEQKSKNKMPTSGEILNPQNLEAGNSATDSKSEAKRKRHKKKAAKGEILTTIENPQDSVIAKKDENTNKVLEATSTESQREDKLEIGTTITKTVSKVEEECTEVVNNETEKKEGVGLKAIDVIPRFPTSTKKLLVFDVNGLLADIVQPPPEDAKADMYIIKRAIFKRPFLEDFLSFCFERFHIGIWSSRNMIILKPVVNYLLGDLKYKLLFLWDAGRCTRSRMNTLEVRHKKIVFKDLGMIWEKNGPNNSWQRGTFNESNTLLLDDSPYKALLNPKHSGIFPVSYSYKNKNDDFLGPNGSLRTYLEGVAATDNLKTYVEQNPFGQRFIDEKTPQWTYYSRAIKSGCR